MASKGKKINQDSIEPNTKKQRTSNNATKGVAVSIHEHTTPDTTINVNKMVKSLSRNLISIELNDTPEAGDNQDQKETDGGDSTVHSKDRFEVMFIYSSLKSWPFLHHMIFFYLERRTRNRGSL